MHKSACLRVRGTSIQPASAYGVNASHHPLHAKRTGRLTKQQPLRSVVSPWSCRCIHTCLALPLCHAKTKWPGKTRVYRSKATLKHWPGVVQLSG